MTLGQRIDAFLAGFRPTPPGVRVSPEDAAIAALVRGLADKGEGGVKLLASTIVQSAERRVAEMRAAGDA